MSHRCPGGHIKKEKSTGGIYSNNTCYLTHYIPHVISPTHSRYQKAGRRFFILCLHYNFRIQYPVSTLSTAQRQQATAPGPHGHVVRGHHTGQRWYGQPSGQPLKLRDGIEGWARVPRRLPRVEPQGPGRPGPVPAAESHSGDVLRAIKRHSSGNKMGH